MHVVWLFCCIFMAMSVPMLTDPKDKVLGSLSAIMFFVAFAASLM